MVLFQNAAPISYKLRRQFENRWVRFHSLPESKRYPDGEEEMEIVLHRHNAVLESLAAEGCDVALVTTHYSNSSPLEEIAPVSEPAPDAIRWRSVAMHKLPDADKFMGEHFMHLFVKWSKWMRGVFDPTIRLTANDVIRNVLLIDSQGAWCVSPYDGGMDCFLRTSSARDALRIQYADWLSPHPKGL
ncbi:MAG: hypothetical protein ACKV2Q_17330 [Planctomycetaceae bacterium]